MSEIWQEHTFAVCAYKESEYLEECVKSLLMQRLPSNILLTTSTPNQHIKRIAEKYKLPLFINEGEGGIARDWNFAYHQAGTPYVTLAHQDDIYHPDYTLHVKKAMEKKKYPLIFFCNYFELRDGEYVKNNTLLKVKRMLSAPLKVGALQNSRLLRRRLLGLGNYICCPSVTYAKRNLPQTIFKTGFRSNVDWEAWEKISRLEGSFVYDKGYLMAHRIHEESETSSVINGTGRREEDLEMLGRFWPERVAKIIERAYGAGEKSNQMENSK